eukprot:m.188090 g.188090  ORF g.188090 m.188090 type:complete len:86 (-) comp15614_c0_seq53:726-983(-)
MKESSLEAIRAIILLFVTKYESEIYIILCHNHYSGEYVQISMSHTHSATHNGENQNKKGCGPVLKIEKKLPNKANCPPHKYPDIA